MKPRIRARVSAAFQKKWDEYTDRVRTASPQLAMEGDALLNELLEARRKTKIPPVDYSAMTAPIEAIIACLSQRPNVWRTTRSIIDEILQGGYDPSAKKRRQSLRDAIYYHTTDTGKLVRTKDDFIGLPSWKE